MKSLTFDEAFSKACELLTAERNLSSSRCCAERVKLRAKMKVLENRITPAARSASLPFRRAVLKAAIEDLKEYGSHSPIRVIREVRFRGWNRRCDAVTGEEKSLTDDAIRKALRHYGFRGLPGRPPEIA